MATKILRPVPTFEQVIRLPDPVVGRPLRIPEVSRPDPNVFMDEHITRLLDLAIMCCPTTSWKTQSLGFLSP